MTPKELREQRADRAKRLICAQIHILDEYISEWDRYVEKAEQPSASAIEEGGESGHFAIGVPVEERNRFAYHAFAEKRDWWNTEKTEQ